MLTTVKARETRDNPIPTENPFLLYTGRFLPDGKGLECSLEIEIPPEYELRIRSIIPKVIVTGWAIEEGKIVVLIHARDYLWWKDIGAFALCEVVERNLDPIPVRFAQKDKQGRRIIRGDVKPVENRDTLRDTESGE